MLVINVILGATLTMQSIRRFRSTIDDDMMTFANTAATFIDGEVVKTLTEEDDAKIIKTGEDEQGKPIVEKKAAGSDKYESIVDILIKIMEARSTYDIKYIYLVNRNADPDASASTRYYFTVDADPVSPAYWGKYVVYTTAMDVAWNGTPSVDSEPYEDEWGKYYSAWSPIKDDNGTVVSIVGVDFDAEAINSTIFSSIISIIISIVLSITISTAIIIIFSFHYSGRLKKVGKEFNILANDLDTLFDEIVDDSEAVFGKAETPTDAESIESLGKKTQEMRQRLKDYIDYLHKQATTDYLTKTENFRSYSATVDRLEEDIKSGTAKFALAIFDINSLKQQNDTYGHEHGNLLIKTTAKALKKVFGGEKIYRIGGDEFIAIILDADEKNISAQMEKVDLAITEYRANDKKLKNNLYVSKGYAVYDAAIDGNYQNTFNRADKKMYEDKKNYYTENNRRQ